MTENNQRPIPPQAQAGFTAPNMPSFGVPPMAGQPQAQPHVQPSVQGQQPMQGQQPVQEQPKQAQGFQQQFTEKVNAAKEAFSNFGKVPGEYVASNQKKASVGSGQYDNNFAVDLGLPPVVLTTKIMSAIMIGVCFFGLILGALFFGGGGKKVVQTGLEGVVRNPEIPPGRRRCGMAEKTQGCTLYIMNAERRDREARDFYDEASRVTGVPVYTIKFGNVEYATSIVRPEYIAQINIPPIDK
ncbi:MAG: hypothetical protein IJC30_02880 [Alphaproteobacteria bacterium]|nr:hypothetical protein [Alphaproteobacteria bacterium]